MGGARRAVGRRPEGGWAAPGGCGLQGFVRGLQVCGGAGVLYGVAARSREARRAGAPCGPLQGAGLPDMAGLPRVRAAPAARSAGREPPQGAPGKPPEAARGGRCLRADKMIEEEKP